MQAIEERTYVCPETKLPLKLAIHEEHFENVIKGRFISPNGPNYEISNGIPDLTYPPLLHELDEKARIFYNQRADAYDKYLHLTFETFGENETTTRNKMIDTLQLLPHYKVLEVSAGTGRDSELIAKRLDSTGKLYLQDISPIMLDRCVSRLKNASVPIEFSLSNGCWLPFPDHFFDSVYHFGGLGEFSDIPRALAEFARVTKIGGRVVFGDESMPPWLRNTRFAKIMSTTNPQFAADLPLQHIPVCAREVTVRWIIGGVFYLIDFVVGEGEPTGNFNYEIPGPRGGTHLTRVDGQLEGVRVETKNLALQAIAKSGKSMHAWLDAVVQEASRKEIDGK